LAVTLRPAASVRRDGGHIEIPIELSVYGPSWAKADHVTIYSNGRPVWNQSIPANSKPGIKWNKTISLTLPAQDAALVAQATGPGVLLPVWEVRKPYQPTSDEWTPMLLAVSAAAWIDGDGDGARTAPRTYARRLIDQHGSDMAALVAALAKYDSSVTLHTLDLLRESNTPTPAIRAAFPETYDRYVAELTAAGGRLP
jgi:hypothetical protein